MRPWLGSGTSKQTVASCNVSWFRAVTLPFAAPVSARTSGSWTATFSRRRRYAVGRRASPSDTAPCAALTLLLYPQSYGVYMMADGYCHVSDALPGVKLSRWGSAHPSSLPFTTCHDASPPYPCLCP